MKTKTKTKSSNISIVIENNLFSKNKESKKKPEEDNKPPNNRSASLQYVAPFTPEPSFMSDIRQAFSEKNMYGYRRNTEPPQMYNPQGQPVYQPIPQQIPEQIPEPVQEQLPEPIQDISQDEIQGEIIQAALAQDIQQAVKNPRTPMSKSYNLLQGRLYDSSSPAESVKKNANKNFANMNADLVFADLQALEAGAPPNRPLNFTDLSELSPQHTSGVTVYRMGKKASAPSEAQTTGRRKDGNPHLGTRLGRALAAQQQMGAKSNQPNGG